MISFYLGAVLCVVVAAAFVIYPWFNKGGKTSTLRLSNQSLTKQRLQELQSEQQQGLLSASDKQQAQEELTLALLDESAEQTTQTANSKLALILGALVSLAVGLAVYSYANQVPQIQQWQQAKANTAELGQRMLQGDQSLALADLQTFALGLRSKLANNPQDAMGWMLLGRVSGALNRVDSAIQAFEKSLKFDPNNTGTLASYAQALLMTGQEQQVVQAKRVLLRILQLEPDNTNAMGVLAIVASELGDKQLALANWQRLLPFIPPNDQNYAAVQQRITELKAQLNQTELASSATTTEARSSKTTKVQVTVDISPSLKAKLPATGVLFVFAQQADGQVKMPAAVVKLALTDFPLTVELSDKNAMMPNFTLSQLKQAKIVARVSKDDNVATAAGELQGEQIIQLAGEQSHTLSLTIDREL